MFPEKTKTLQRENIIILVHFFHTHNTGQTINITSAKKRTQMTSPAWLNNTKINEKERKRKEELNGDFSVEVHILILKHEMRDYCTR